MSTEHEVLESSNIFESYISTNKPEDVYAFSPKIYDRFKEICDKINVFPTKSLIFIGFDSFLCHVSFYKAICGVTYIFLIGQDGIREYYRLE